MNQSSLMDNEERQIEFAIIRILDCGFQVEEAIFNEPTAALGYGMNLAYDLEQDWVQLNIRAEFKQPQSGIIFLTGTVLTRFSVRDLKSLVGEDGVINFPKNSLETLFSISFGHMRAILSKNCAGSRFATYIVPAINPSLLFQDLYKSMVEYTTQTFTSFGIDLTGKQAIELFDVTLNQNFRDKQAAELATEEAYRNLETQIEKTSKEKVKKILKK